MDLELGKLPRTSLGATCGKYTGEQAILRELDERQAFMNRQMSLTGLKQVDAVVMNFGANSAGALTSRRNEVPHVVLPVVRPSPRASSARRMKLNAIVTGHASLRKGPTDVPKMVAAPRSVDLHVVGVNVVGQISRNDGTSLKEANGVGMGGQDMMRPGHRARASARRIFKGGARNATACDAPRPKTAPVKSNISGGSFADDSMTIRGMFNTPRNQAQPSLHLEAKVPVSAVKAPSGIQSGMRGSYLVMRPECHIIKGMRPALQCMPAQVFYGSLKASLRNSASEQAWGRVEVFENANHK